MKIRDLRKIIANLPDDMVVSMYPSDVDELTVRVVETYPDRGRYSPATLLLMDKREDGAGGMVVYDETEGGEA